MVGVRYAKEGGRMVQKLNKIDQRIRSGKMDIHFWWCQRILVSFISLSIFPILQNKKKKKKPNSAQFCITQKNPKKFAFCQQI